MAVRPSMTYRMHGYARTMRSSATDAESILWELLRAKRLEGLKFRRQVVVGPFIVDFVCPARRLVIEVDGSQHGEASAYDQRRTDWLRQEGYTVVRFWNGDVLRDPDGVCQHILRVCGP